jgi:hypothetical protein
MFTPCESDIYPGHNASSVVITGSLSTPVNTCGVSFQYMAVAMGYNTQGFNTLTLRHQHPLLMLDIVPSKCVRMHNTLQSRNPIMLHVVMTPVIGTKPHPGFQAFRSCLHRSGVPVNTSTGCTRVSSAQYHRTTRLQPHSSPIALPFCAWLSVQSTTAFCSLLTLSAFFYRSDCSIISISHL